MCQRTKTRKRSDLTQINRQKLFVSWLLGKLSKDEIAQKYGINRKTLTRWFTPFWSLEPTPKQIDTADTILVIVQYPIY